MAVSGKNCGLELRRDKCEVWSKGALNTIDSRIKRNSRDGLEILGAAVGSPRFVASSKQKRVQKIEKLLENLGYINDPQCALGILRSCLDASKMVYSLRCNTPSEEAINIFDEFDSFQRTTFENILGTVLSNESWHQACLPINKTGIGIRRASDQIKAAYICSVSQSATLVELITGQIPTADHTFSKMIDEINGLSISQLTQSKIQEVFDEVAVNTLIENQTSEREKARLLSLSATIRSMAIGFWASISCQTSFVEL